MSSSSKIIILLTPFHCKQLKPLTHKLNLTTSKVIVLHSNFVNPNLIDDFKITNKHVFPFQSSEMQVRHQKSYKRIINFFLNPLKSLDYYKKVSISCRKYIESFINNIDTSSNWELIVFNDRDVLFQLLVECLNKRKKKITVTAIDEGAGYYAKEGIKEFLLKVIYKVVSKPILGFNYRFIEQYGTHPVISKVYLQYPNLLPKKKSNVEYYEIPINKGSIFLDNWKQPCVLFFSTTLSEENLLTKESEIEFYSTLKENIIKTKYTFLIKPHPRESSEKILYLRERFEETNKFIFLDPQFNSEEIDYLKADYIVHFGSSIAMHVIFCGFDPKRIWTIKILNFGIIEHIFKKTNVTSFKNFESKFFKVLRSRSNI